MERITDVLRERHAGLRRTQAGAHIARLRELPEADMGGAT